MEYNTTVTVEPLCSIGLLREPPMPKRRKYSQRDADRRLEEAFRASWTERVRLATTASQRMCAADRMQAIRDRIAAKNLAGNAAAEP